MKKWVSRAFIAAALLVVYAIGQSRPRFEFLYSESIGAGTDFKPFSAVVFHDRETGQEVVCMFGGGLGGPSCYTTGRKW